jgi:8-oxo-dGTP diphosphatase
MDSFKNPAPAVDMILFYKDFHRVVLIKRKNPPLGLALPGGFVNEGESLETAVKREIKEELSVDAFLLEQFITYSHPYRDPRKHVMSTVFLGCTMQKPVAADDAAGVIFLPVTDIYETVNMGLGEIVFDHKGILFDANQYIQFGRRPRFGSSR